MNLGNIIRKHRKNNRLTLKVVAEKAGISEGFLSQIENNVNSPSVDTLINICNSIGVNAGDLITQVEKQETTVAIRKEEWEDIDTPHTGFVTRRFFPPDNRVVIDSAILVIEPGKSIPGRKNVKNSQEVLTILEGSLELVNGLEGISILKDNDIDLIVLDVGLPDISGFELIKDIRKVSDVPVIFLTARSDEIDRVLGLELGADDYMVKPFSPRELTARVKTVLRRVSGGGTGTGNDTFRVDSSKRLIYYFGNTLNLTRYEYDLLILLINRPGWVFSREKIMEMVWSYPEESFDRTVDTHIKTIRNKLKSVKPEIDPITTHRGIGYSLREDI